eukprot:7688638-Pyramimonas_sp.AAC.1
MAAPMVVRLGSGAARTGSRSQTRFALARSAATIACPLRYSRRCALADALSLGGRARVAHRRAADLAVAALARRLDAHCGMRFREPRPARERGGVATRRATCYFGCALASLR